MTWIALSMLTCGVAITTSVILVSRLFLRLHLAHRMGRSVAAIIFPRSLQFFLQSCLRSLRRRREKPSLERRFPFFLDMLCLSLEAGLDFVSAIARIADQMPHHPMGCALQQLLADLRLGRTRSDALRRFRRDVSLPAATRLTSLLIQADRLGAPLAELLRNESNSLRFERFQNAERLGQMAAQKLLFPLVFCIMPVVFLLIFGPLIVQLSSGGIVDVMGGGL